MTGSATIATTIGNYLLANHRAASTCTGSCLIFDIDVESNFLKLSGNWPVWWEFRSFPRVKGLLPHAAGHVKLRHITGRTYRYH